MYANILMVTVVNLNFKSDTSFSDSWDLKEEEICYN
jgi:hypothetical protein